MGSVLVVGTLIAAVTALARSSTALHPPTIAGQAAPAQVVAIDFGKRYDLHCALGGSALGGGDKLTVYRRCKIIGFTAEGQSGSAGSYGPSSASYFSAWLALELPDGRRAYLPPSSLKDMEESEGN